MLVATRSLAFYNSIKTVFFLLLQLALRKSDQAPLVSQTNKGITETAGADIAYFENRVETSMNLVLWCKLAVLCSF